MMAVVCCLGGGCRGGCGGRGRGVEVRDSRSPINQPPMHKPHVYDGLLLRFGPARRMGACSEKNWHFNYRRVVMLFLIFLSRLLCFRVLCTL